MHELATGSGSKPERYETMDSRRSYLDNLNAGRQRRPQTSLDQLTRSLSKLEQQLDQHSARGAERPTYRDNRQRMASESAAYRAPAQPTMRARDPRVESGSMASELDALRNEMHAILGETRNSRSAQSRAQADTDDIKSEIERLTATVQGLARRGDDKAVTALRLELEQARAMIETLAREETVRSIGNRWDEFEARMTSHQGGGDYSELAARIDDLHASLDRLPETLPLRSIDERFRQLSTAVEGLISQRGGPAAYDDEPLRRLEDRMEEIARTIQSASRAPAAFDDHMIERVERRLDEISRSIASSNAGGGFDVDGIDRIESRIAALARQMEDQMSRPAGQGGIDQDRIVDAIETRLDELQARFANDKSGQAFQNIEDRLDDLASRMDQSNRAAAGIDPLTVSNLEAQIANLSTFLSRPDPIGGANDELSPRLDRLERSIQDSHDLVVSAASEAAEQAVRRLGVGSGDASAAAGLASDLQDLEALTRRSDERNSKTFEAIHDTLLKIVDRLGSLEKSDPPAAEPTRRAVATPPIAPEDSFEPVEAYTPAVERTHLSPAQAAAAAAKAAIETPHAEAVAKRSMLGGLARKLSRKEPEARNLAGSSVAVEAPAVELDAPLDPRAVNRPLEPGSGAPDLNAIMKRVRDERGGPARGESPDVAKADFIAAARRAAQAAAAEAQVLKTKSSDKTVTSKKGGGLRDLIAARRKPILMAAVAVMIAIAGIKLSNSMLAEPTTVSTGTAETSQTVSEAPAPEPVTPTEPAKAAATPIVREAEPNVVREATPAAPPVQPVAIEEGPDTPISEEQAALTPPAAETPTAASETASIPAIDSIPVDAGPIPLREAAAGGDSKALFEIGARYSDGRGVKADMKEAATWYEKSAELGFAPAQYRIGNFYEKGNGVTRDVKKAKTWYQLAANQGNASAMHNLAVLFAIGADGTPDNDSAARWFTQAAEFGVKDSQFNLGILAAKGVGMPQNLEESYKWFALVAKAGDRDAAAKRDEIAKSLRPEQLERARATVELWKPKEPNAEANSADIPESWQESAGQTTAGVDMKKAIRNVQGILNKNGYDAGPADGMMGERTKLAIMAFQKDSGLTPNGNVDKALVEALLAKN